jgi:hypothetical protein
MELELSGKLGKLITALILVIIPLIILLFGVIYNVLNIWFYVAVITWFGVGIIFYLAIN